MHALWLSRCTSTHHSSLSSGEETPGQVQHTRDVVVLSDSVTLETHALLRDHVRPSMAILAPQDSKLVTTHPTLEPKQDSVEDTQKAVNKLIGIWLKELETDDDLRQQIQKIRQSEEIVQPDATTQMGQVQHTRDIGVMPTDDEAVTLRDNVKPDMATLDPQDSSELVAEELPPLTQETNQDSIVDVQKKANKLIDVWIKELEKDDTLRQEIKMVRQNEEYKRNLKKIREQYEYELSVVESSYRAEVSRLNNRLEEKKRESVRMGQICQGLDRQLRENEAKKDEELREIDEQLREKDKELSEKDEELEEKDEVIRQLEEQLNQLKHQRAEKKEKIRGKMKKEAILLVSRVINGVQVIKESGSSDI